MIRYEKETISEEKVKCPKCKGFHTEPEDKQTFATRVCYWSESLEDGWVLDDIVQDLVKSER